jgi:hypothetical protein
MNRVIATAVALFLATFGHAYAQGYPGPQGGRYIYGPDHEYHLLSRNQPYMQLRQPWRCSPQFDPYCNMLPPPGYPLQPIAPPPRPVPPVALAPPPGPSVTMEQSREQVIRAGEAHCQRFNDPVVCHEKK